MADSSYGLSEITLDLAVATARTVKDAATGELAKINSIRVNGTAGAGTGTLVFRKNAATTGPIILKIIVASGAVVDGTIAFPGMPVMKGLYVDAIGTAWTAGAICTIYTS